MPPFRFFDWLVRKCDRKTVFMVLICIFIVIIDIYYHLSIEGFHVFRPPNKAFNLT